MNLEKKKAKFKKSVFSFVDKLATKKLLSQRPTEVEKASLKPIREKYNVNELVEAIHPKQQHLKVDLIKDLSATVKLVRLIPADEDKKVALFRPGQYLNISFDIDGKTISRPYSIASSLKDAHEGNYYDVAIKYKHDGYVSKFVHKDLNIGDVLKCNAPDGDFFYSRLRDSKNVICLAGGIGITPIYSLAKWIDDYNLDITMTILYSNTHENEIVYNKELDELASKNKRIKIKYFVTKQEDSKHTKRRISFDDIKEIENFETSSYFICGPKRFCTSFEEVLLKNNIKNKFIRTESSSELGSPKHQENYENVGEKEIYKVKVRYKDQTFEIDAFANETVFSALQRANLPIKSNCLSGKCSMCRVRLVNGEVFTPKASACYRQSDYVNKIIYTCSVYPVTDLEIDML